MKVLFLDGCRNVETGQSDVMSARGANFAILWSTTYEPRRRRQRKKQQHAQQ